MRHIAIAIIAVLLTLTACDLDGRKGFSSITCESDACFGTWEGTAMRSKLYPADELLGLPDAPDAWSSWECMPNIDADACVFVDGHGHMTCVRVYGEWAVPVAPSCAFEGPGWLGVGLGMSSPVEISG